MSDEDYARAVYDVLVRECGAYPESYEDYGFAHHWPECREWRFQGNQGFGGKVWAPISRQPAYVTCYLEDDNAERKASRNRANAALAALQNTGADL